YYDSTAGFIFLILVARFFQKKAQTKYSADLKIFDFLKTDKVLKVKENEKKYVRFDELEKNDLIVLKKNDIVPVDACLVSQEAIVDVAVLNGEPTPRVYNLGMLIPAGSKILNENIQATVALPY